MSRTLAAALFAVSATVAVADEKAVTAQKQAADANARKAGVGKPAFVETADLIVVSGTDEPQAKRLADAGQKAFAFARTALQFDEKEPLWPGKLTVYVLPDAAQFRAFVQTVEQRRPEKGAWHAINTRSDTPYAAVGEELGETTTDAERQADVAAVVAAALVNKKAGATPAAPLPEWVRLGFGRAAHARAEGGAKLAAFKAKAKTAVLGGKGKAGARAADVWGGAKTKDSDAVAASLVDYMVSEPAKFGKFLGGFKPADGNDTPTVTSALEAAEWKTDALELGWAKWVRAGK